MLFYWRWNWWINLSFSFWWREIGIRTYRDSEVVFKPDIRRHGTWDPMFIITVKRWDLISHD